MLRVATLNANGIRSSARKGVADWLRRIAPDVIAIQELKAHERQVPPEIQGLGDYHATYVAAQKKGYSGVALLSRRAPDRIVRELGMPDMDAEGRFVRYDFGPLSVVSLYIPSGTSGLARQAVKYSFMERFLPRLAAMRRERRRYIVCGDFNIAHREIDVHDPKNCSRLTGFLPAERKWLDTIVDDVGWCDAFRRFDRRAQQYTWWSSRVNAFERNLGWRLDYQLVSPALGTTIARAEIFRDERFSDHAPLIVDYDV
ncbi:MAG: exodeoxyribonuclease III [Vulcanimicrobiaceae bacterium]